MTSTASDGCIINPTVTVEIVNALDKAGLSCSMPSKAAYSLRRLSSLYTGNLIRVRRSSDNTTLDIGYDSNDYLDTNSLKTFVGSGNGYVTAWYDQSGGINDLTQANNATQPIIDSSGAILRQCGNPYIAFYGMLDSNAKYLSLPTEMKNVATANAVIYEASDTAADGFFLGDTISYFYHANVNNLHPSYPGLAMFDTTYASLSIQNGSGYYNGVSTPVTSIPWPSTLSVITIEPDTPGTNTAWDNIGRDRRYHNTIHGGGWAEIIISDSAFSNSTRQALECSQLRQYFPVLGVASLCPGGSTITLADSVAGGTWSSGNTAVANIGTSGVVTSVGAGTAVVSYTTLSGCSVTATITVNPAPSIPSSGSVAICIGASTTVTAAGGVNYSWAPATGLSATTGTSLIANPTATTIYTVTVTDSNGCINTASDTVSVYPLPIINGSSGVAICSGTSTSLIATGGVTYSWSPATGLSATSGGSVTANPTANSVYTITGTDANGCMNIATDTVTVNPLPTISGGSSVAICTGSSTSLTATGGVSYTWSPSLGLSATTGSSVTANPTVTTTYTVTGTNSNGCANAATVTVSVNPLPTISGGSGVTITSGSSATLTASGGISYTWAPAAGLSATTGASVSASPTATATYTVTGVNSNGCSNSATVTVTVTPPGPTITVASISPVCAGSSVALTASGGATYSWTPATGLSATTGASVTASPTVTTTYTVTGTSLLGASNTAIVTVTINPLPVVAAITGAGGVCVGSTTTLSSTTAGGVWSSSAAIATVGTGSGIVTGVSMGVVTISYTVTALSCSTSVTKSIEVASGLPQYIYTCAGTGVNSSTGDGGPANLATLQGPRAIATDTSGNIYISDVTANRIRKISTNGYITTVAGNGTTGNTGDGGPATAAELSMAGGGGVYVDKAGNIYIACSAVNTIRKVNSSTGIITTIAGTAGTPGFSGDGGPASASLLIAPLGMCEDTSGNLYIVDQGNYRIRKISASTGIISTIVGMSVNAYGGDGGPGTAAWLSIPRDVTADKSGNLYICDYGNSRIRKYVLSTGIITTVAGTGVPGFAGDGGPATAAELNYPARASFDGTSKLYVADQSNNRVRQINLSTGIITTVVANGTAAFSGDGGPSTAAELWSPCGVAVNKNGQLFVADGNNRRVRGVPYNGSILITLSGPASIPGGTSVTFTASSSINSPEASLQWQKNGTNIGSGSATLTTVPSNGDEFRCILSVSPECGSAFYDTSNTITITTYSPPTMPTTVESPGDHAKLVLYPNPVHDKINLVAQNVGDGEVFVKIYDEMGRTVLTQVLSASNHSLSASFTLNQVASGSYILRLTDADGQSTNIKFIKN